MSQFLFPPLASKSIPVSGESAEYPIHRIFCVGRNYAAHAAEMGVEVDREAPFYFTKTPSAYIASGATIPYPPGSENFHYEMELALVIGKPAFKIAVSNAASAIYGYACALDMTRRDLQQASRSKQRPWDLGKDVENSAVVSTITKAESFGKVGPQRIHLSVNGETKQDAHLSDLIWSVEEIVSDLSKFYHLQPGDVIMTGTPAGVGPVVSGDKIFGSINGLAPIELAIGPAE